MVREPLYPAFREVDEALDVVPVPNVTVRLCAWCASIADRMSAHLGPLSEPLAVVVADASKHLALGPAKSTVGAG